MNYEIAGSVFAFAAIGLFFFGMLRIKPLLFSVQSCYSLEIFGFLTLLKLNLIQMGEVTTVKFIDVK